MARRTLMRAFTVVVALSLASCSKGASNNERTTPASSLTTTPTMSPTTLAPSSSTPSIDPQVKPAVTAYLAYNKAYVRAAQHPANAALFKQVAKYTFDPLQVQLGTDLGMLQNAGIAFGGTPPTPRISVLAAHLDAKPYPTVSLSDCPTPPKDWAVYNAKTGRRLAAAPHKARPPYLTTATVIHYAEHWGVQKASTDYTQTCTA